MDILTEDQIDFRKYMEETDPAAKVRCATEFTDEVNAALAPDNGGVPKHPKLPFANCWLYLAPGELTIWGGFNGSGKSMLQGQVLCEFALTGIKVCIASFEMTPAKTIARMIRQHTGQAHPTPDQVAIFMRRAKGNLFVYDQQGAVKPDRIIAVIKHCAEKMGCQHIGIDSLMKCVSGTENYDGQKNFVDAMTICARDYNVHLHLVAHLKKGEGDERMPTRMDISGTGAISDLADNVILVWRNKKKERDRDAGKVVNEDDPDSVLIVDKARNGEWEGRVRLWYDRASLKFSDYNKVSRRGLAAA
jgi:twinkle protein